MTSIFWPGPGPGPGLALAWPWPWPGPGPRVTFASDSPTLEAPVLRFSESRSTLSLVFRKLY